jgi:hypothetical protein
MLKMEIRENQDWLETLLLPAHQLNSYGMKQQPIAVVISEETDVFSQGQAAV